MRRFACYTHTSLLRVIVYAAVMVSLTGCFTETLTRWLNKETYDFSGTYVNEHNDDRLVFKDAVVTLSTNGTSWTLPYEVEDRVVRIQVRNNSKEKRPDIVMSIYNGGERLICSACAVVRLSNIWQKEGTQ